MSVYDIRQKNLTKTFEFTVAISYGGGGTTAYTLHPKIISGIQATQKTFEILATKQYPPFFTLTVRKDPKMHRNDP